MLARLFFWASSFPKYGAHVHFVDLTAGEKEMLYKGDTVVKKTTMEKAHQHEVKIIQRKKQPEKTIFYKYLTCDGETKCFDGHPPKLIEIKSEVWMYWCFDQYDF